MFMDRWGRKKVLLVGATGMGIAQLIVGTLYAVYKDSWASHRDAGWATAVFIWIYISNFAFSIGCVNWIMPSEIFPPGVRSQAVGVAIGTNWLSNVRRGLQSPKSWSLGKYANRFLVYRGSDHASHAQRHRIWHFLLLPRLVPVHFPPLVSMSDLEPAFCIFLWVWVFFWVPETKGLRMEEMDALFGGNQGEQDLQRIASIRARLGITHGGVDPLEKQLEKESDGGIEQCEEKSEKA